MLFRSAKSHATLHNPLYTLTLYRCCRSAHTGKKPRNATQPTLHTHSVLMPSVSPYRQKATRRLTTHSTHSLCIDAIGQPIHTQSHATLHNSLYTLTLYRCRRSAHAGTKPRDTTQLTLHTHSVSMPLVTPFSTKPRDASSPSIPQPPNHVFTSSAYPGETCRGKHTQYFVYKNARKIFCCPTLSSPLGRIHQVKPAGARTHSILSLKTRALALLAPPSLHLFDVSR